MPCPAPWFAEFSEQKKVAEVLGCRVYEVDDLPIHWKLKALAYSKVMEKARPGLEKIAEDRAARKMRARDMLQRKGRVPR